jgi:hypothetical protein
VPQYMTKARSIERKKILGLARGDFNDDWVEASMKKYFHYQNTISFHFDKSKIKYKLSIKKV